MTILISSSFRRARSVCLVLLLLLAVAPALPAAELDYPLSIAVADNGDFFLADRNLPGIWRASGDPPTLSLYFEGSKKFRTTLNAVRCVRLDREGKLLAGDSATRNVYRFDDEGQPQPVTTATDGMGLIGIPMDIAVNSAGDLFVSDLEIQRVVKIAKGSNEVQEVAEISGCRGLFVDGQDRLWVVSTTTDQLHRIAPDGQQTVVVKGRPFQFPHTVAVASDGTAYVCDGFAKTIWKVDGEGQVAELASGEPFVNPVGLAIKDDVLYVADPRARAVFRVSLAGEVTTVPLKAADE